MRKTKPKSVALLAVPILLSGCIGQPLLGPLLARPNSFVRSEQMTEIRWLDAAAMREPPPDESADEWIAHVNRECPGLLGADRSKFLPALLLPLLPIAAEFAVDAINGELKAESKLYAAQFSASATTSESQRCVGFELRRTVRGFGDETPACVIRFAIWQNEATAPRVLLIRPLSFQTRAARAKLLLLDRDLNSRIDIALRSISISNANELTNPIIAAGTLRIDHYDVTAGRPLLLRNQTIAVAALPAAGLLTATVIVTEHDAERADETFEQLSTLLTEHRSALIAASTQPAVR